MNFTHYYLNDEEQLNLTLYLSSIKDDNDKLNEIKQKIENIISYVIVSINDIDNKILNIKLDNYKIFLESCINRINLYIGIIDDKNKLQEEQNQLIINEHLKNYTININDPEELQLIKDLYIKIYPIVYEINFNKKWMDNFKRLQHLPGYTPDYVYECYINNELKLFFKEDTKLYIDDYSGKGRKDKPYYYYTYLLTKIKNMLDNRFKDEVKVTKVVRKNGSKSEIITTHNVNCNYIDIKFSESDEMKNLKNIYNIILKQIKNNEDINIEFIDIFNDLYDITVKYKKLL